jgi:glycosyltransferase involved in cell wall biosynthesis
LKKARILFVVNGFSIGGGELKLLELIRELKRQYSEQFECFICSVGIGGPLKKQFESLGYQTVLFKKSGRYDFSQVTRLTRMIRQEKINLVQTTLFYADVIGTYAAKLAGLNRIISWEAVTQPYKLKHLTAYRLASKWFARSVAVSHAVERQLNRQRHVSPLKTCTIQYGVDTKRFAPGKDRSLYKELNLSSKNILIGTVARLTEQKGHRYLIEAMPEVLRFFPDARFIFIGDGPLFAELDELARSRDVAKAVHFLGFRTDISRLLQNLDLFVLPSLYEGLPNVVLEAMACGLPVVATAVDGTPEAVVHGKTGILVPSRQSKSLEDALISLLNKPGIMKQFGQAGRKRIENQFSLESQVAQFVTLYQSMLQGG